MKVTTEVVLFHHLESLTDGVRAFAEGLSVGGLYDPDQATRVLRRAREFLDRVG